MSTSNTAKIFCSFRRPGFHCWPDAPESHAYLRDLHRHIFHVEVALEVLHDDREVEFHWLLDQAEARWDQWGLQLGHRSCEMLARELAEGLAMVRNRRVRVVVSEDGENGASVEAEP